MSSDSLFIFLLTGVTFLPNVSAQAYTREILESILSQPGYNKNDLPPRSNLSEPLIIYIQAYLRTMNSFDDAKQEIGLQMTFRMIWNDSRHAYENTTKINSADLPEYIVTQDVSRIYVPEAYTSNANSGFVHRIFTPNVLIRIWKNGTTLFSTRLTIVTTCAMNLTWYPFDSHNCPIRFGSYSLACNEARLQWSPYNPIELDRVEFSHPSFGFKNFSIMDNSMLMSNSVGKFCGVVSYLKFKRKIGSYLLQVYFPCIMFVIISWISFWFDVTARDSRVSLGITTILSMVTLVYTQNSNTPTVSYVKALDVFTGICLLFVKYSLLEFATIDFWLRKCQRDEARQIAYGNSEEAPIEPPSSTGGHPPRWFFYRMRNSGIKIPEGKDRSRDEVYNNALAIVSETAKKKVLRIDLFARFAMPLLFLGFNIVYFTVCLTRED